MGISVEFFNSPIPFLFSFFFFRHFFSRRNQGIPPHFDLNDIAWGQIMKFSVALIVVLAVLIASQIYCDAAAISEVMSKRVRRGKQRTGKRNLKPNSKNSGEKCRDTIECKVGICSYFRNVKRNECRVYNPAKVRPRPYNSRGWNGRM